MFCSNNRAHPVIAGLFRKEFGVRESLGDGFHYSIVSVPETQYGGSGG